MTHETCESINGNVRCQLPVGHTGVHKGWKVKGMPTLYWAGEPYQMDTAFIKPVKFGLKNMVGVKSPVNGGN